MTLNESWILRSWYSFLLMPFHNKEGELLEGNDVAAFQAHSDKKKMVILKLVILIWRNW